MLFIYLNISLKNPVLVRLLGPNETTGDHLYVTQLECYQCLLNMRSFLWANKFFTNSLQPIVQTVCPHSAAKVQFFQCTQGKFQTAKKRKEEFRKHVRDHKRFHMSEWTSGRFAHRTVWKVRPHFSWKQGTISMRYFQVSLFHCLASPVFKWHQPALTY